MDLGSLLVLLKLAGDTGFTVSPKTEPTPPTWFTVSPKTEPTPPTSTAGVRPDCGSGQKAVFFQNPDRWVCVPKFK